LSTLALAIEPGAGRVRRLMTATERGRGARPREETGAEHDDRGVVAALQRGDEQVFMGLVQRYRASMLWVAQRYVRDRAIAEDVVQETWLAVLQGIDRFEGRSSLRTWIYRILVNRAQTRAQREGRSVPFSALADPDEDSPSVDPSRFQSGGRGAGQWSAPPQSWAALPEDRLESRETFDCIRTAIEELPDRQRAVIALRDIDGWTAMEVSEAMEISDANQRVLLHRARSKVRAACERMLGGVSV
jgi:RNA polymerase sigma-70 factor, ECF subfamily